MKNWTALSRPYSADFTAFFLKSGQNSESRQNRDRKNPDRQTANSLFSKNPDRILTADRIEKKIRTERHRTNPDSGQTPNTIFRKSGQTKTRTGHGQCCPSMSDIRRVEPTIYEIASINFFDISNLGSL